MTGVHDFWDMFCIVSIALNQSRNAWDYYAYVFYLIHVMEIQHTKHDLVARDCNRL